ncbi:UNVERIFIED_CONTAM: Dolichol-phosphate mannose synthase subunit 3 [Sesamum indicum]
MIRPLDGFWLSKSVSYFALLEIVDFLEKLIKFAQLSKGTCDNLPLRLKSKNTPSRDPMKHIVKITALLVALSAFWISLLQTSVLPETQTWLLPLYFIVSLGCYGLLMVGVGLMLFPTCPHEAILLQEDIAEAKGFLKGKGVDVGSD